MVVLSSLGRVAAAEEPALEIPRLRVGIEGMVSMGYSTGGEIGVTGDLHIREPLDVRARVGYGRLTPNYEQPDPDETVTILRFELGVELRKDHGSHAFFAGLHGGVQRMSGGWIIYRDSVPWAALFGGQFGFEVGKPRLRFRFGFDIRNWRFVGSSGTEYGPLAEVAFGF